MCVSSSLNVCECVCERVSKFKMCAFSMYVCNVCMYICVCECEYQYVCADVCICVYI